MRTPLNLLLKVAIQIVFLNPYYRKPTEGNFIMLKWLVVSSNKLFVQPGSY